MNDIKLKPIFKYIGGKRWMEKELREKVSFILDGNNNIDSYCEPFAGGLGSFLSVYDILIEKNIKNITLNDKNENVIRFYQDIKHNPERLLSSYFLLEDKFEKKTPNNWKQLRKTLDKNEQKEKLQESNNFYKNVRDSFNNTKDSDFKSHYLLFLQKHCFNGIYRENKKGKHNVPFNWSADKINREDLINRVNGLHELLNKFDIQLLCSDYKILDFNKNTLYYLDPPYLNDDSLENNYSKEGFSVENQLDLINKISHTNYIYSNHYSTELIEFFFKTKKGNFSINIINRKNIISSGNRDDDKKEILIYQKLSV